MLNHIGFLSNSLDVSLCQLLLTGLPPNCNGYVSPLPARPGLSESACRPVGIDICGPPVIYEVGLGVEFFRHIRNDDWLFIGRHSITTLEGNISFVHLGLFAFRHFGWFIYRFARALGPEH
jgi:hypothetical protein